MGSGSLAAMATFDSKYREGLTMDEGVKLVTEAICSGIFNDLGCGSNVDVCVMTKGQTEYLRNHQLPNPRTYITEKGYAFAKKTVKHDCVFGDDLDLDEISFVSEVLRGLNRSILYSLSPGTSVTPAMAKDVKGMVNMYRIMGDDWDKWEDIDAHFNVTRDFSSANMIGAPGLLGTSRPDLDMLPLGWLTNPGVNEGLHRSSNLNLDEQKTQTTLWSMAKSPLMFGGDVRKLDDTTFSLITNCTLLEINYFSSNNMEASE